MANHKSAIKAHQRALKRRANNGAAKSAISTFSKKVELCAANQDVPGSVAALRIATSKIMKAVSQGILKKNTAARKVGNLAKKINFLESQATV